ncbi:MAG: glycosyltransferase family 39 protein [Armatimonadota bacterium]
MTDFIVSIILILVSFGWGAILNSILAKNKQECVLYVLMNTLLGMGVVSLIVFAFSALGLLNNKIILISLIAVGGLVGVILHINTLFQFIKSIRINKKNWIVLFVILALFLTFIAALSPPVSDDWDSLAYHLAIPKIYLENGGFKYIEFSSHSNFPFMMEMLYTLCLSVGSIAASRLTHFWCLVLLLGFIFTASERHFKEGIGVKVCIAFCSIPIVLWLSTTAYIDITTSLFSFAGFICLLYFFDDKDRYWVVLCGIFAGLAASTKMTALGLPFIFAVILLAHNIITEKKARLVNPIILILIGLAVCSPWYIKSLIYTGNPVYPFFYSIFGGRDWTKELADNYAMLQSQFGAGKDILSLILLPFNLTFHSELFYDRPGLFIGPIAVVAPIVLFLCKWNTAKIRYAGIFLFFLIIIWWALTHQSRYLVPAFAVLCIIIVYLLDSDIRYKLASKAFSIIIFASLIFSMLTIYPLASRSMPYVLGKQSADEYLYENLEIYPVVKYINQSLDKSSKIAMFGDTRGFYLDREYVWADPGHNTLFTRDFDSKEQFISYLKSLDITHIFINHAIFPTREKAEGSAELIYNSIDDNKIIELYRNGPATVYKIQ